MLRAVLFDLDDTLIDWSGFNSDWAVLERQLLKGVLEYLATQGHRLHDLDAYVAEFRTRAMAAWTDARTTFRAPHVGQLIVQTAGTFGIPAEAVDMELCLKAYQWGVVPGTIVFPDVVESLKLLIEHGIKIGIVTNAPQPMIMRDLELTSHGLFEYFPLCRISAADVGVLKPHPDIFYAALDLLEVEPSEAVFVGDDLDADIYGAQGLGMKAVLRVTRRTEDGLRDDVIPDARIHRLTDLPPLLDQWFPDWRKSSFA